MGFGLCFHIGFRALPTLVTGAAVGIAAAIGMLAVSAALSSPSAPFDIWTFLPSIARDWQEVIEYVAIVTLVTLAANVAGWMLRDRQGRPATP
jgi:hypothetical protein